MAGMIRLPERRIPIIGEFVFHVGQVVDIVSQPCQPSPWIAVTAFWQYFPLIIWSVAKPDPIDDAIDRFGGVHKKRRRRRMRVHSITKGKPPPRNRVSTVLFPIQDAIQKYGFYFIVADATADFLVNWTSAAYLFNGCQVPNYSNVDVRSTAAVGYSDFSPATWRFGAPATVQKHVYDYVPPVWHKTGDGPWKFVMETTVTKGVNGTLKEINIAVDTPGLDYKLPMWAGSAKAGETVSAQYTDMNVFSPSLDFTIELVFEDFLALENDFGSLVGQQFKVEGLGADP